MQSTPLLKRIGILDDIHCEDKFLAMHKVTFYNFIDQGRFIEAETFAI